MGKGINITAGLVAITTLAPWAIFLGGLCKLTDAVTGWDVQEAMKQMSYMLEWYIVSAEFVIVVVVAIAAFAGALNRAHSMIQMWLAVNTALLIYRATQRITTINMIDDLDENSTDAEIVELVLGDPLPYLRAIAAGQVATAGWNFLLSILVGYAGTDLGLDHGKHGDGQPRQIVTA